jgi:hypothetical protein
VNGQRILQPVQFHGSTVFWRQQRVQLIFWWGERLRAAPSKRLRRREVASRKFNNLRPRQSCSSERESALTFIQNQRKDEPTHVGRYDLIKFSELTIFTTLWLVSSLAPPNHAADAKFKLAKQPFFGKLVCRIKLCSPELTPRLSRRSATARLTRTLSNA